MSAEQERSGPWGSGPGEITPDGCAVDFYALLPAMGEADIVHRAVTVGGSVLELGCGTGRVLRPLVKLGHPVLGVDESAAMLAHLPDLPTICSPIESLELGRTFDAVLLASTMINTEPEQRRAFLAACGRHVPPGGVVVIQQTAPAWFADPDTADQVSGGVRRVVKSLRRRSRQVDLVAEYHAGGQMWTHAFSPHEISEPELDSSLAAAGLRRQDWLTADHAWFTATLS